MLDHVSVGVTNLDRNRRFYDAALRPLGLVRIVDFGRDRGSDYGAAPGSLGVEFTITKEGEIKTPIPRAHLCFRAPDRQAVDAFFMRRRLPVAGATVVRRGCGHNIMPATTALSCWTLTVIALRLSAMRRQAQASCLWAELCRAVSK